MQVSAVLPVPAAVEAEEVTAVPVAPAAITQVDIISHAAAVAVEAATVRTAVMLPTLPAEEAAAGVVAAVLPMALLHPAAVEAVVTASAETAVTELT